MYVTIREYDGVEFHDEAAAKVRNEFLPIVSKIPGFHKYYALRTGEKKVASINIFRQTRRRRISAGRTGLGQQESVKISA